VFQGGATGLHWSEKTMIYNFLMMSKAGEWNFCKGDKNAQVFEVQQASCQDC
jgi:hypothetical protein